VAKKSPKKPATKKKSPKYVYLKRSHGGFWVTNSSSLVSGEKIYRVKVNDLECGAVEIDWKG